MLYLEVVHSGRAILQISFYAARMSPLHDCQSAPRQQRHDYVELQAFFCATDFVGLGSHPDLPPRTAPSMRSLADQNTYSQEKQNRQAESPDGTSFCSGQIGRPLRMFITVSRRGADLWCVSCKVSPCRGLAANIGPAMCTWRCA
jgi:hypothetical protein